MGFGDLKDAMRFRDILTSIATDVVERLRPEVKIGKVYSVNLANQTARILFPGETNTSLVNVHFAKNMVPMVSMETTFTANGYDAVGDIVRVAGKPGSYFILDFISTGGWITATLVGAWTHLDTRYLQYRRDQQGMVRFRGIPQGGTGTICYLPDGFGPEPTTYAEHHFAVAHNGAFGCVRVGRTGGLNVVDFLTASTGWVDLSTITYKAGS